MRFKDLGHGCHYLSTESVNILVGFRVLLHSVTVKNGVHTVSHPFIDLLNLGTLDLVLVNSPTEFLSLPFLFRDGRCHARILCTETMYFFGRKAAESFARHKKPQQLPSSLFSEFECSKVYTPRELELFLEDAKIDIVAPYKKYVYHNVLHLFPIPNGHCATGVNWFIDIILHPSAKETVFIITKSEFLAAPARKLEGKDSKASSSSSSYRVEAGVYRPFENFDKLGYDIVQEPDYILFTELSYGERTVPIIKKEYIPRDKLERLENFRAALSRKLYEFGFVRNSPQMMQTGSDKRIIVIPAIESSKLYEIVAYIRTQCLNVAPETRLYIAGASPMLVCGYSLSIGEYTNDELERRIMVDIKPSPINLMSLVRSKKLEIIKYPSSLDSVSTRSILFLLDPNLSFPETVDFLDSNSENVHLMFLEFLYGSLTREMVDTMMQRFPRANYEFLPNNETMNLNDVPTLVKNYGYTSLVMSARYKRALNTILEQNAVGLTEIEKKRLVIDYIPSRGSFSIDLVPRIKMVVEKVHSKRGLVDKRALWGNFKKGHVVETERWISSMKQFSTEEKILKTFPNKRVLKGCNLLYKTTAAKIDPDERDSFNVDESASWRLNVGKINGKNVKHILNRHLGYRDVFLSELSEVTINIGRYPVKKTVELVSFSQGEILCIRSTRVLPDNESNKRRKPVIGYDDDDDDVSEVGFVANSIEVKIPNESVRKKFFKALINGKTSNIFQI